MTNEYLPLVCFLIFTGLLGALALFSDSATRQALREKEEQKRKLS